MNQLNVNLPELPYAVSEAMNRLRINIKFCGKNTRKILLTSCQPNEGKSTISSYLWKMLAEAGFPTVLVDVDLRKSVMKTRFQMDYDDDTTMGLNHYLSGMRKQLDKKMAVELLTGVRTHADDFYSRKTGKLFSADLLLDTSEGRVAFQMEFPKKRGRKYKGKV